MNSTNSVGDVKMQNPWLMLVCGTVCMLVMGTCYTYGLFQPYIMRRFNVSSAIASFPYTIFTAAFCFGNFMGGVLQQKIKLRSILTTGYILMVLGWFTSAYIPLGQFWLMYLTFGGLFGIGDGIVYNVIVSLMPKWLPDRKGLASGITLTALGVSATIFSLFADSWLKNYGYNRTFIIFSLVYIAIGIFGGLALRLPPQGYTNSSVTLGISGITARKQYTLREALHVKELYTITGLYFCAVPAYQLLSAVFVSYGADRGLTSTMATPGVSIASIFQTGGRFIIPTISDKIGRKLAFSISFLFTTVSVGLLSFAKGPIYMLCFWIISLSYGGCQACFSPTAADMFGTENLGIILSFTMIGFGVSSVVSSLLAKTMGFSTTFVIAGIISMIGIALVYTLPKKEKFTQ